MKTFTFRYDSAKENLSKRLLKAARSRQPDVHPDEIVCSSFKELLDVATESRLRMLQVIINDKPTSLYALARLLKKSQAYVLREAKVLEALGIIELVSDRSGKRERLRPVSQYDKVVIDCRLKQSEHRSAA